MCDLQGFQWIRPIKTDASKKITTYGYSFSVNSTRNASMEIGLNDREDYVSIWKGESSSITTPWHPESLLNSPVVALEKSNHTLKELLTSALLWFTAAWSEIMQEKLNKPTLVSVDIFSSLSVFYVQLPNSRKGTFISMIYGFGVSQWIIWRRKIHKQNS